MTKKGGDGNDPVHREEDERTRKDMERERKHGPGGGDKKSGGSK